MARLARIRPGETVMDPMMGNTASIPIGKCSLFTHSIPRSLSVEASHSWQSALYFGGDISPEAVEHASRNIKEATDSVSWTLGELRDIDFTFFYSSMFLSVQSCSTRYIELFQWNAIKLPLMSGSIDTTITDVPTNRRQGTYKKNFHLYPRLERIELHNHSNNRYIPYLPSQRDDAGSEASRSRCVAHVRKILDERHLE
jgi:hypothetical protein